MNTELRKKLHRLIAERVFVTKKQAEIGGGDSDWIFDFRSILLTPEGLDLVTDLFWEQCENQYPFQVGGLEAAAIPLVTGIVMKSIQKGKPVNGFFIRKSRNKKGLLKMIEGRLDDTKIILVDDLINLGGAFLRQIEVLKRENRKVASIFTVMHFRALEQYAFAKEEGINILSLFALEDFGITSLEKKARMAHDIFNVEWVVSGADPDYYSVMTKSVPLIDDNAVYFGTDDGLFFALDQTSGAELWRFRVLGFRKKNRSIFSSPATHNGLLYIGAHDGNFYALDKKTGKKKWVFMEADWVDSSPCIAAEFNLVFVGLKFGLWTKRGGIVALDATSGEKKWQRSFVTLTTGSPAYSPKYGILIAGSDDEKVYCFKAKNGELLWESVVKGFVRASFVFDEKRELALFGTSDGNFYALSLKDGSIVYRYETGGWIASTPLLHNDLVFVASLDKTVYCFDLVRQEKKWEFVTAARIFSSPLWAEGRLYIGTNEGRFYEIDPGTGKAIGFFLATERITTKSTYNPKTKRFFVPTFANELYCLRRSPERPRDKDGVPLFPRQQPHYRKL